MVQPYAGNLLDSTPMSDTAEYKQFQPVWVDGEILAIWLCNRGSSAYVATSGSDYQLAYLVDARRLFPKRSSEFVISLSPCCAQDI